MQHGDQPAYAMDLPVPRFDGLALAPPRAGHRLTMSATSPRQVVARVADHAPTLGPERYDVFVSYNRAEGPDVERIARRLREEGLAVFFDRWSMSAGRSWRDDIAEVMQEVSACAAFVGPEGLGDWAREELALAHLRAAKDPGFRLFMVLLPGAPSPVDPRLAFLRTRTWVDLRPESGGGGFDDLLTAATGVARYPGKRTRTPRLPVPGPGAVRRAATPGLFFGREDDVRRMGEMLRDTRFMAVVGPSGSGKSSVVKAGLIPALRADAPSRQLGVADPHDDARRPSARCSRCAARASGRDPFDAAHARRARDRRAHVATSALPWRRVGRPARIGCSSSSTSSRRSSRSAATSQSARPSLRTLPMRPPFRAVAQSSSSRCAPTSPTGAPHTPSCGASSQVRRCCSGPWDPRVSGARSSDRPGRRAHARAGAGGYGPRRHRRPFRSAATAPTRPAAGLGASSRTPPDTRGLRRERWRARSARQACRGGLRRAAAEQRDVAERLLLRLVQPGEGTEDARRRIDLDELMTAGDERGRGRTVVRALADERLVTTGGGDSSEARRVEITHEALLHGLASSARMDRTGSRGAARPPATDRGEPGVGALGAGRRVALSRTLLAAWRPASEKRSRFRRSRSTEAVEWRDRRSQSLNQLEREFLDASDRRGLRDRTARRRRMRFAFAGLAAALAAVTAVAILAVRQGDKAANERDLAVSRELAASATSQLVVDPELSVLLASEAMRHADTAQAEDALKRSVAEFHSFTKLAGHTAPLRNAVFSPDEQLVLTASEDGTARIWRTATGAQVAVLRGHRAQVSDVVFSRDGRSVLTASEDGTARLWDAASGDKLAVLRGHTDSVTSAALSPDGTAVVTAGRDGTARLWRTRTGSQVAVLRGHRKPVATAVFSPDGRRVLTAGFDGTARTWRADTGRSEAVLRGHRNLVHSATFSANGRLVVTASVDGTARVWRAATGKQVAVLRGHTAAVGTAVFSPDGKFVATGGEDTTARIWRATTGAQELILRGHTAQVSDVAFSRNGRSLVTAAEDRTARLWDTETGDDVAVLRGHKDLVVSAALSSHGTILTSSRDNTARVWQPATNEAVRVLRGHTDEVVSAAFSADRRSVVTASHDGTARIWNAATGEGRQILRGHTGEVGSAAFGPKDELVVTGGEDRTARVWEAATGKTRRVLRGHTDYVSSAVFSGDGRRVLTGSADRSARIWDAATGRTVHVLRAHTEQVESAAFGLHDRLVVTASEDETAQVWDAATGTRKARLKGHTDQVEGVAFSGDGSKIVTASSDDTARIWDAATGQSLMVLRGHDGDVESTDFSANSRFIATASDDQTAWVWDAAHRPRHHGLPRSHDRARERGVQPRRSIHRDGQRGRDSPNLPL